MSKKLTGTELEDWVISLTEKQKKLLQVTITDKYLSGKSAAIISIVRELGLGGDRGGSARDGLGGVIGTLVQKGTPVDEPILRVVNRDSRGRKIYGLNTKIVDEMELSGVLDKLLTSEEIVGRE